jgi:diguanylate cyclase (GGDEF)-like protein/PAS domain S-box-containing protein
MNLAYAIALLISAVTSAAIAFIAWKRRSASGASGLMLFMLAEVVWAVTYAVRWMMVEPSAQLFWLDATFFGAATHTTLVLIFALQFTGLSHLLTRRNLELLAIVPLVTLLLLWTDDWHGLFFGGRHNTDLIYTGGIWFWFFILYTYMQVIILIGLFVKTYLSSSGLFRRQVGTVLLAAFLPVVGNILGLVGFSPFPNLDLTPFIYSVSGPIYAYALFGLRILDVVPVARHKLVDEMMDGIMVLDANKRIVDINPAVERLIGISSSAIGQSSGDVLNERLHLYQLGDLTPVRLMERHVSGNPPRDIELQVLPLHDKRQNITGHLLILHDITERKQAEEEKWNVNVRLRTLSVAIEQSPVTTVITDLAGNIVFVNPKFTETTGYTAEEAIGQNPSILKTEFKSSSEYKELWDTILSGENWHGVFQNKRKNGELYWESATISPVKDVQGVITHFLAVKEDITERKQAEDELQKNAAELKRFNRQLEVAISNANEMAAQAVHTEQMIRESEARYRAVFDSANDAIVSSNNTGTIISWNHGAEVIFNYSETEAVGLPLTMLMPSRFSNDHLVGMERMQTGGEKYIIGKTVEVEGQRKDGSIFPLEISLAEWWVGNDQFYTAMMRDITERKQAEAELHRAKDELQQSYAREQQLSRTDGLTGIDNHRSLLILAKREFEISMRYQPPLSMMFFDIDNFKQINDIFGHAIGDQALIKITQTVCDKLRSADLIGRYGGDEFVILLPQTSAQDALPLANRIHASIADMRLDTDKGPLTVTISIGIAQTIHGEAQTDTVENLLMRADQALYSAKQAGRNCTMLFEQK